MVGGGGWGRVGRGGVVRCWGGGVGWVVWGG